MAHVNANTRPKELKRKIILEALKPDANISKIARDYNTHRNTIYGYLRFVIDKPEERMRDAETEAAFRRKVYEMTR